MATKRKSGRSAETSPGRPVPPQAALLTLTELEQVRVLADPLRLRIVEQLCRQERTTKQVAEELGEKPTKLYHHVEALEKVGLIRQTRTRRKRGTLERYYLAVARAFKADQSLFAADREQPTAETMQSLYSTIFGTTARELSELTSRGSIKGDDLTERGVLSFLRLELDEPTARRLVRRLQKLLRDVQALDEATPHDRPHRLTLAFYPLGPDDEASA